MAKLTPKGRKNLSTGAFALPGRRYPINDLAHARNALARVSQHGTPSEKAQVKAAVRKKYPSIDVTGNGKSSSSKKKSTKAAPKRRTKRRSY